METKETAVEWLYDTLIIFPETNDNLAHNASSFKQAKAMEKEQIEKAYESGCIGEVFELNCNHSSEQYYNETYGK